MIFTVKTEKRQQLIDIREAFNVWDILNSKYMIVERLQMVENFAHDLDLKKVLQKLLKNLQDNISILEKQMNNFAIKSPDRNRSPMVLTAKTQIVTDEFIAQETYLYLQEHIENMSKKLRSTVTNDGLRQTFKRMLIRTIDQTERMLQYVLIKGWLSVPPLYKHLPQNVQEKLSVAEAANLWDHTTLRYDNIKTTELFLGSANDVDFKAVLQMGLYSLAGQAQTLEKELRHFGIPLPKKPSKVTVTLSDTEIFDDDYMYRVLANGLQGALILHAKSFKESVVNGRIRSLFKKLLVDEIEMVDKFLKYGKLKGWLHPVPGYGP